MSGPGSAGERLDSMISEVSPKADSVMAPTLRGLFSPQDKCKSRELRLPAPVAGGDGQRFAPRRHRSCRSAAHLPGRGFKSALTLCDVCCVTLTGRGC